MPRLVIRENITVEDLRTALKQGGGFVVELLLGQSNIKLQKSLTLDEFVIRLDD